jgi:hypothetical protein
MSVKSVNSRAVLASQNKIIIQVSAMAQTD